ncbi:MAG: esterase family protein [Bacteroidales bacterium]|nr:esterase family protein [Bacteroidales bacterium]
MNKFAYFVLVFCLAAIVGCQKDTPTWVIDPDKVDQESTSSYKGVVIKDVRVSSSNVQNAKCTIYLPSDWKTSGKKYPVLYLLHGMWSNNNEWVSKGLVDKTTDELVKKGEVPEIIVVTPDCRDCFYVDDYVQGQRYESFFHKDLMPFIEKNYPALTGKANTAVAGLSMGGYGSVYHAFMYPDKFCLCYSMSGAVEGMGTDKVPSLKTIFETKGYTAETADLPKLILECGTEDNMCFNANVNTHNYLESIKFPHSYITRPGIHDWNFWTVCYPKCIKEFAAILKATGE